MHAPLLSPLVGPPRTLATGLTLWLHHVPHVPQGQAPLLCPPRDSRTPPRRVSALRPSPHPLALVSPVTNARPEAPGSPSPGSIPPPTSFTVGSAPTPHLGPPRATPTTTVPALPVHFFHGWILTCSCECGSGPFSIALVLHRVAIRSSVNCRSFALNIAGISAAGESWMPSATKLENVSDLQKICVHNLSEVLTTESFNRWIEAEGYDLRVPTTVVP